jgi:23S rRNA (adenine2503-C2)-methyltransferase
MLRNINDSDEDATRLIRLLDRRRHKLNLIPFNPVSSCRHKGSTVESILLFQSKLMEAGFSVFIRQSQGAGIDAGCGQLASKSGTNHEE